ncbi:hypothetical protein ACIA6C_28285 [Streptomyces sp. NPDC051578]|uniref:hypothetical protein n=1 Tax=Streptomyces sp. NPDC051578 TaxID=3365662 RepID=UPI0037B9EF0A
MPRPISWPTREEWQAKAEQSERTSCFARERVSSDPAEWLGTDQIAEGRVAAAKLVRATRIALGKAGLAGERSSLNQWYRDAADEGATVDDLASGWFHVTRYARMVQVMPEAADRLAVLGEALRTARDAAAEAVEEKAVATAVATRASDEGWAKELERRARVERGPQVTTITVHQDGSSTVSAPVPFQPPWPSY